MPERPAQALPDRPDGVAHRLIGNARGLPEVLDLARRFPEPQFAEHRREIGERGARERASQRLIDLHGKVVRVGLDPETSGTPAPCDDGPDDGLHRVLGIREADMVAQPTPLQKRRLVKLAEHHDRVAVRRYEAPVIARPRGVPPREVGEVLCLVHEQDIDATGGHLVTHRPKTALILGPREDKPRVVVHVRTSPSTSVGAKPAAQPGQRRSHDSKRASQSQSRQLGTPVPSRRNARAPGWSA